MEEECLRFHQTWNICHFLTGTSRRVGSSSWPALLPKTQSVVTATKQQAGPGPVPKTHTPTSSPQTALTLTGLEGGVQAGQETERAPLVAQGKARHRQAARAARAGAGQAVRLPAPPPLGGLLGSSTPWRRAGEAERSSVWRVLRGLDKPRGG